MQIKFIENTNEQYSIREDGQVTIHYIRKRITNYKMINIYNDSILKTIRNSVNIVINNKPTSCSINSLLFKYFNYKICYQCNNKFTPSISPRKCNNCRINNRKKSSNTYTRQYYKDNTEKCRNISKKSIKFLEKRYIAATLKIKTSELTEELYNSHKNLLSFKRQLAKTHNISIHSLK